jgi:hypothetical protein
MLERYSHIRMAAKRAAVAGVTLRPKKTEVLGVAVNVPVRIQQKVIQYQANLRQVVDFELEPPAGIEPATC